VVLFFVPSILYAWEIGGRVWVYVSLGAFFATGLVLLLLLKGRGQR
jgi:hypothetical protein